jgi:hypothetical protein
MTGTTEVLEVHLEEMGRHARGLKARFLASLGGGIGGWGGEQHRFVARERGPDRGSAVHVLGPAFPVVGGVTDLDNQHRPNAYLDLAEQGLEELDRQLVRDGWVRGPDAGPHWWSRTYTRRTS